MSCQQIIIIIIFQTAPADNKKHKTHRNVKSPQCVIQSVLNTKHDSLSQLVYSVRNSTHQLADENTPKCRLLGLIDKLNDSPTARSHEFLFYLEHQKRFLDASKVSPPYSLRLQPTLSLRLLLTSNTSLLT